MLGAERLIDNDETRRPGQRWRAHVGMDSLDQVLPPVAIGNRVYELEQKMVFAMPTRCRYRMQELRRHAAEASGGRPGSSAALVVAA
jgi:hypothetical protein